jgi:hypothetical protein
MCVDYGCEIVVFDHYGPCNCLVVTYLRIIWGLCVARLHPYVKLVDRLHGILNRKPIEFKCGTRRMQSTHISYRYYINFVFNFYLSVCVHRKVVFVYLLFVFLLFGCLLKSSSEFGDPSSLYSLFTFLLRTEGGFCSIYIRYEIYRARKFRQQLFRNETIFILLFCLNAVIYTH